MLAQVNATRSEGAVGVYDDQFLAMEKILEEVRSIIDNFNQSESNIVNMTSNLNDIRYVLDF